MLQKKLTQSKDYIIIEEDLWNTQIAGASQIRVLARSRGAGPDGDDRLVLVRGHGT